MDYITDYEKSQERRLTEKEEKLKKNKIRTVVYSEFDEENLPKPRLLIFGE